MQQKIKKAKKKVCSLYDKIRVTNAGYCKIGLKA